ncbi:MAG: N-acetylmuramoyl-L-alanine amidase [Thermotogae bacterium]|nr:N-acetylmuramoyl-L-alanine amidase [Thermotogota bacterium]
MRILLDPGHGGSSLGTTEGFLPEKEINLRVVLLLARELEREGWEVFLTREDDSYLSLDERVRMVMDTKPDVFLSVHHNAYEEDISPRSEIYTGWNTVSPSYDLAYAIYDALVKKIPTRRFLPPLPSTYTVVQKGPQIRLLTELFFAREMNEEKIWLEAYILKNALISFSRLPTVHKPNPFWCFEKFAYVPGHRTTLLDLECPPWGTRDDRVVILRDGRVFWYGLYLSRRWNARYIHTGMTLQEGDLHVALRLNGFRGTTIILDFGEPEVRYYHTDAKGRKLAEALNAELNFPIKAGSDYLLIHLYGRRVKIVNRWGENEIDVIARILNMTTGL